MIQTLSADAGQPFERGPFSVIDHAHLAVGTVVRMHEHVNDEILSYVWRGTMIHEDSAGHREALTPRHLMMMNAGRSFWHEESTPDAPVEMLQIFFRPREADLDGRVQFLDRPVERGDGWTLIAGPAGSDAPLEVRQAVRVYDTQLAAGDMIEVPAAAGLSPWLYVMDGEVRVGDTVLGKGQAAAGDDLLAVRAGAAATLVLFLIDTDADGSRAGTISGR